MAKESSYKKLPVTKPNKKDEEKKYYVLLETDKERMERIVEVLEFIGTAWLRFVKMIQSEPSIPFPTLPNNSCMVMVPTSFRWTNPKTKTSIGATTTDQYDHIEVYSGEGDWKRMTPEEAFAAIKTVFTA